MNFFFVKRAKRLILRALKTNYETHYNVSNVLSNNEGNQLDCKLAKTNRLQGLFNNNLEVLIDGFNEQRKLHFLYWIVDLSRNRKQQTINLDNVENRTQGTRGRSRNANSVLWRP